MATTNAGRRFARAGAPRRRAGGCSSPPRAPVACLASAFHADVTGQYHTYAPAPLATSLPLPPPGHVARAWLRARTLPVPRSLLHRGRPRARARAAPAALLPRAACVRSQRQQRGACARRLGLLPKCISHELHFDITTNPIYIKPKIAYLFSSVPGRRSPWAPTAAMAPGAAPRAAHGARGAAVRPCGGARAAHWDGGGREVRAEAGKGCLRWGVQRGAFRDSERRAAERLGAARRGKAAGVGA